MARVKMKSNFLQKSSSVVATHCTVLPPSKSLFSEKLESNPSSSIHNKAELLFFSSSPFSSSLLLAQLSERNLLSNCNPACLQGKEGKGKKKMIDLYEPQRLLRATDARAATTEESASSSETAEKLYKILRGGEPRGEEELKKFPLF